MSNHNESMIRVNIFNSITFIIAIFIHSILPYKWYNKTG